MTSTIDITDWLKAQPEFTTKKRLVVFTDIIHTPSGERVVEGFRYVNNSIDEVLAAFQTGDAAALAALDFALDEDGDPDTTGVCIQLAYTKGTTFLAAQPQHYVDYQPINVAEPRYLTSPELAASLDQSA